MSIGHLNDLLKLRNEIDGLIKIRALLPFYWFSTRAKLKQLILDGEVLYERGLVTIDSSEFRELIAKRVK